MLLAALLWPLWARADREALWHIVHARCVAHAVAHQGSAPCAAVDLAQRYALLKDRRGVAQFLLIATDRITGIEDGALRVEGAPDYWRLAWRARIWVQARAPHQLADAAVGLAINPRWGRSQDQFHIHIDCAKTAVVREVAGLRAGAAFMSVQIAGSAYRVRQLRPGENAFRLIAAAAARAHSPLAAWSMAMIGPNLLLATRTARAEDLLDPDCKP